MELHELLANVLGWYAAFFCGFCLAWYACALLGPRRRWSFWVLGGAYSALWLLGTELISSDGADSGPGLVRLLLMLAVSLLLCLLCCRQGGLLLVYVCVSWSAIFELAFFIAYTVVFAGDPIYDQLAEGMMSTAERDPEAYLAAVLAVAYAFQIAMSAVLTLLCIFSCRSIIRSFPGGRRQLKAPEFRLLILPAVIGLMIGILLRMLIIAVADGVPVLLFDRYPLLKIVVPAIAVVAAAAIIYAVRTFRGMMDLEEERRARLVIEGQLRSLRELVRDTEQRNERVSRLRHDLHNTLTVIQALAAHIPEGEALSSYLTDLNGELQALARPYHTGDPVADTLLALKAEELRKIDPEAEMDCRDFVLPGTPVISSYDMGIILGNALDNALRALERQQTGRRWLRLQSFRHEDLLFITVENSADSRPDQVRDGLPASTKEEEGHGMGLYNIRSIAAKYGGTMDWRADGGAFRLSIMVKMPEEHRSEPETGSQQPAS